ncbi:hypothetical protein V1283_006026 [Bradyrhizobium sp. AZCC 2262]
MRKRFARWKLPTTYFRNTGISKPKNSNAASPLTQPCNGVATIGSLLAPMGWRYYFFGACMSKPRNSNGVSPLTQPCHVCGWNRMTSSGL